ncbi:uncharacterized protein LOC112887220 isoform X3 [Panicum hallii]|uniref:uncharacterized protein LOC112887220 isoform X3 n=1 Tax=Panicum hallii TaxID=206008 RepID=UPI000DF4ECA1|nr:uncharacterized protein LOC112887220 isoform X3 [Panicum hallii]
MASAVASMPAMAAATITAIFSPSLPSFHRSHHNCGHRAATTTMVAFSRRFRDVNPSHKRSGGKATLAPATDEGFGVLEMELWRLRRRVELRLHRLAVEADEAYRDLRYAARDVGGDRMVITFRRSSLRFAACTLLWSLAFAVAARALLGMVLRAWWWPGLGRGWWGGRGGGGAVVRRRDRSLGGKEVVVAVSSSPVSAALTSHVQEPARVVRRREPQAKVPDWWPEVGLKVMEPRPEMEKWTRLANRLVRAIIDNRITGRDYTYDDAIQLRKICKTCGIKIVATCNKRHQGYGVCGMVPDCRIVLFARSIEGLGQEGHATLSYLIRRCCHLWIGDAADEPKMLVQCLPEGLHPPRLSPPAHALPSPSATCTHAFARFWIGFNCNGK